MSIRLSGIFVYPVKAVRAVPLNAAAVTMAGLQDDRRWVVVDRTGRFISQRTHPGLAVVQAEVRPDGLHLRAPGRADLVLAEPAGRARLTVTIWRDQVSAAGAGPAADHWFSSLLGEPCQLAWMDPSCRRPPPKGVPDEGVPVEGVPDEGVPVEDPAGLEPGGTSALSFADGFPVLIAGEASLADLNRRLGVPVPMSRFRPNLVFTGGEPFAEDRWQQLRIGGAVFQCGGPCARCQVTTIDQESGLAAGPEPLRTLARFRQGPDGVQFGANLVVEQPGPVAIGDAVEILA